GPWPPGGAATDPSGRKRPGVSTARPSGPPVLACSRSPTSLTTASRAPRFTITRDPRVESTGPRPGVPTDQRGKSSDVLLHLATCAGRVGDPPRVHVRDVPARRRRDPAVHLHGSRVEHEAQQGAAH